MFIITYSQPIPVEHLCNTRGGGLPYITDGDARRNFQKQPLKVTILGGAPAKFIP